MADYEQRCTRLFQHKNEITWGEARIPFAPEIHGKYAQPRGWVLPGGIRTVSREVALAYAMELNEYMRTCARTAKSEATALIRSAMKKETSA